MTFALVCQPTGADRCSHLDQFLNACAQAKGMQTAVRVLAVTAALLKSWKPWKLESLTSCSLQHISQPAAWLSCFKYTSEQPRTRPSTSSQAGQYAHMLGRSTEHIPVQTTGFADHTAAHNGWGACRKHTARLPPDLIWLEWFNGRRPELRALTRGRPLAVYRSNLLDHIGSQSSFAVRTTRPKWPGCFDSMAGVWSLHKTERFQVPPARELAHRLLYGHCHGVGVWYLHKAERLQVRFAMGFCTKLR